MWLTKWGSERRPDVFFWQPEIATVDDQGMVLYDASICPLHHKPMSRGEVKLHYGTPKPELLDAIDTEFPGGPGFVLGGCVLGSKSVEFGFRCDACIAAYEKWTNGHSKD